MVKKEKEYTVKVYTGWGGDVPTNPHPPPPNRNAKTNSLVIDHIITTYIRQTDHNEKQNH